MAPLSILIVGCSIAGPSLASFLLLSPLNKNDSELEIVILERAPSMRPQGQNIDVRGAGITLIRKLGLERAVRDSTTGEEGVKFVDENDIVWAAFAADKTGKTQTPTSDTEIMRGRLAELCYLRCKTLSDEAQSRGGKGVEWIFGDQLDRIEQEGDKVRVRFAKSGKKRQFDVVVGADGLQSSTRKLVWGAEGEEDRIKKLGMYSGFFSMPPADTDSAWRRWFHTHGRRGIMLRPDKQNDRTTVFMSVLTESDDRLIAAAKRGPSAVATQKALLEEYFKDAGWECDRIIKEMKATDDFYYDMVAQVKMDKWSRGRIVLLGDAGYCGSPLSGMGTTLALSGAYNLAGALSRHPSDVTTAFSEYEEEMRPTVEKAQKLAPGMPWLIHPETAWGVAILNYLVCFMGWIGLFSILVRLRGPPAGSVPVKNYGIRDAGELTTVEL